MRPPIALESWSEVTDQATLGAFLRAARRRRRVSIERAADQTRIRSDYIMRMESDEFDFLAPAYVRGFLRTYARFLRVDPTPLLAEFAHTFGREHLEQIRTAYDRIGRIVEAASREGEFKPDISPQFAAMCFYGAIEQLLSGWIFGVLPRTEEEYEQAKALVVETICGGLEATPARASA